MRTTGQILIPTVSYGNYYQSTGTANNNPSFNPGYPNYNANTRNNWVSNPVKASSYYRSPGGLQTVAYQVSGFVGNLIFEGTLESNPNTSPESLDWFPIASVNGLGQSAYLQSIPTVPTFRINSEVFNAGVADFPQANTTIANVWQGPGYVANPAQAKFTLTNPLSGLMVGAQLDVIAANANNSSFTGRTSIISTEAPANVTVQYDHNLSPYVNSPNVVTTVYYPVNTNPYAATSIFQLNGAYPADQLIVSVDGVLQIPGPATTGGSYQVTGSTLSFNQPLLANAIVEVREFFEPFNTSNFNSEQFTANGVTNSYILLNDQASYSASSVIVSVNGMVQIPIPGSNVAAANTLVSAATAQVDPFNTGSADLIRFYITDLTLFNHGGNVPQLPLIGSDVNVFCFNANNVNYNSNTYVGRGALVEEVSPTSVLLRFQGNANGWTSSGLVNLTFPNLGSYILTSVANAITAGYDNRLTFDWTPQLGDVIEVREIVGGDLPFPAYTGISAINLAGNFTYVRCRVKDFRQGVINKVTISY